MLSSNIAVTILYCSSKSTSIQQSLIKPTCFVGFIISLLSFPVNRIFHFSVFLLFCLTKRQLACNIIHIKFIGFVYYMLLHFI